MAQEVKIQGNGEVDVEIDRRGIHVRFTQTPKWAYILIAIGLMFALIIGAHSLYRYSRGVEVKKIAEKLADDEPLSNSEVKTLESLDRKERKALKNTIIEMGGVKLEQRPMPGTKMTVKKDKDGKITITKGGE